jgi:hypothetical protein
MPNHIHLVAIPQEELALAVVLRRTHGRSARYFNARQHCGGGAFWSELLGEDEGKGFRTDLRSATYAGKAFGSKEFRAELDKQAAGREEYDHRMGGA